MRQSSKTTCRVGCAFQPIFFSLGPKDRPGCPFDKHCGNAAGPFATGPDHDEIEITCPRAGNELFRAVQDKTVTLSPGGSAQGGGIRACTGLRQAVAGNFFDGDELGKPGLA